MNAIKITLHGAAFLLPDTHGEYAFPDYIQAHSEAILQYIEAGQRLANAPDSDPFAGLPSLQMFKRQTGIIGYPLTAHDVQLYVLDKQVQVIMEVAL